MRKSFQPTTFVGSARHLRPAPGLAALPTQLYFIGLLGRNSTIAPTTSAHWDRFPIYFAGQAGIIAERMDGGSEHRRRAGSPTVLPFSIESIRANVVVHDEKAGDAPGKSVSSGLLRLRRVSATQPESLPQAGFSPRWRPHFHCCSRGSSKRISRVLVS